MARSWPTMTFLTSNSACSRVARRRRRAACRGRGRGTCWGRLLCGAAPGDRSRAGTNHVAPKANVKRSRGHGRRGGSTIRSRPPAAQLAAGTVSDTVGFATVDASCECWWSTTRASWPRRWPRPAPGGLRRRRRLRRGRGPREGDAQRLRPVCLDITMPGIDGREVCRRIRADAADHDPQPRVLMLTARDALEDRVAGLDDGADDYLVKPFAFPELLARVRRCCGATAARRRRRRLPGRRPRARHARHTRAAATARSTSPPRSSPCCATSWPTPARCCPRRRCSSTCGTSTPTRSPTPCG